MSMFERFVIGVARFFPTTNEAGKVRTRRAFLDSTLKVGVGLATLQLLGITRPERLFAGEGPCEDPEGCSSCGPGAVPVDDDFCGHCSSSPPSGNWEYCSCCKTDEGEFHCCWSTEN